MINLKETKRLKQALEENPKEYKSIIENTDLAICITDAKGIFLDINTNYTKLYGFSREELVGQHFTIVLSSEKRDQLKTIHDTFIKTKFEILRNWEVNRKDGEPMKISADAGYSEAIFGKPCKITLVSPEEEKHKELLKKD